MKLYIATTTEEISKGHQESGIYNGRGFRTLEAAEEFAASNIYTWTITETERPETVSPYQAWAIENGLDWSKFSTATAYNLLHNL